MRAEDRHKLQQNELAEWLAKWIERLKPYSNLIFGVVLVVLVGVAAGIWWIRQATAESSQGWDSLYVAMSTGTPAALEEVAAQYSGGEVGHWSAVLAGDAYLSTGCQRLFDNKAVASDELRKAVEQYRKVQEESRVSALHERALFGLGRAYEALAGTRQSQGELDKAIEAYGELVEKWPTGAYGELAAQRLKELQQDDTKALYDKFAQFDPRPALPKVPGLPGERPPFSLDGLSDEGTFPGLPESLQPGASGEEAGTTDEGASPPADGGQGVPAGPEAPPQQEQAGPKLPPQEPAESGQPSGQNAEESTKTPAQGPGESEGAPELMGPEMTPPADSTPKEKPSDGAPAADAEPSEEGPTASKEPPPADP